MNPTEPTFRKGDRVTVSGFGRTAHWGATTGTVVRTTQRRIFVRWDGCRLLAEDEMTPAELKRLS